MIDVSVTPQFRRMFRKLEPELQAEALEKIERFKSASNHKSLKLHKLTGKLKHSYSFSVNYKNRIVFQNEKGNKEAVILTAIGSHDIYK